MADYPKYIEGVRVDSVADEMLLAQFIAQNGKSQGQIVYSQTKSFGLVNWNPATDGSREQAAKYDQERLACKLKEQQFQTYLDSLPPITQEEIDAMCNPSSERAKANAEAVAEIRAGRAEWQQELDEQERANSFPRRFLRKLLFWSGLAFLLYVLHEAARYWVFHG